MLLITVNNSMKIKQIKNAVVGKKKKKKFFSPTLCMHACVREKLTPFHYQKVKTNGKKQLIFIYFYLKFFVFLFFSQCDLRNSRYLNH